MRCRFPRLLLLTLAAAAAFQRGCGVQGNLVEGFVESVHEALFGLGLLLLLLFSLLLLLMMLVVMMMMMHPLAIKLLLLHEVLLLLMVVVASSSASPSLVLAVLEQTVSVSVGQITFLH